MAAPDLERPAFYALRAGGWRDLITLLHPPYTAWHLSYVALGAAAAPDIARRPPRCGARRVLPRGGGVRARAGRANGRPLGTALSDRTLVTLAAVGLVGAVGIGVVGAVVVSVQLAPLVAAGGFIVVAYNLELFGGRFHSDTWFALAWGAFPAFTSYWANALELRPAGVLITAACFALSVAQRHLSTPARELRRRTVALRGEQQLADGRRVELSAPRSPRRSRARCPRCRSRWSCSPPGSSPSARDDG